MFISSTMPKVFISYRREDSAAFAGRVFDRLRDHFGKEHVFRDVDTLPPGAEFATVIRDRIAACDALVAIIGKNWLTIEDASGRRRLDDPDDLVKAEIREALERDKLVIPALVEGARMPRSEDISGQISALAGRNAIEISESRFDYDAKRLIEAVENGSDAKRSASGDLPAKSSRVLRSVRDPEVQRTLGFIGSGIAAVVVAGWTAYLHFSGKPAGSAPPAVGANASGSIVAGGNVTATAAAGGTAVVATGPVTIGITLDQYEAGLKRREQEIRAELAQSGGAGTPPGAQLRKELADVQAKSRNLEKSLDEYKAMLAEASATLEKLRRDVPVDELKEAKQSLTQGNTDAAEALFAKTLSAGREQAAESAFQLGKIAYGKVDYRKAYDNYLEALRLAPDNPAYLNAAGRTALDLGRYADAQTHLEKALAIRRKTSGTDPRDLATSLNNLAALCQAQGRYSKAEPLYQEALALQKKSLSPDQHDIATSINNLAELYRAQGLYAKAQPLYEEAISRQKISAEKNSAGFDPHDLAASLNNLALLYKAQGLYPKAEALYREALASTEKALGADHPDAANTLNNLAALYQTQGRLDQAAPLYLKALAIRRKALGADHPDVATTLNNLAALYQTQGGYDKAEPLYRDALAIQQRSLGADHPAVARTLNNLALLFKNQGQFAKAEPLYRDALSILQTHLAPDDPNLAIVMENYSACLSKLERHQEARQWQERADAIRQRRATIPTNKR